jgi:hypothetical protein
MNGYGYSSSFLFLNYLHNRFGQKKLIDRLLRSPETGWNNLQIQLKDLKARGSLFHNEEFLNISSAL